MAVLHTFSVEFLIHCLSIDEKLNPCIIHIEYIEYIGILSSYLLNLSTVIQVFENISFISEYLNIDNINDDD